MRSPNQRKGSSPEPQHQWAHRARPGKCFLTSRRKCFLETLLKAFLRSTLRMKKSKSGSSSSMCSLDQPSTGGECRELTVKRVKWMTLSVPARQATPNWPVGPKKSEKSFLLVAQRHFETRRLRISPEAIGRTSKICFFVLSRAYKDAPATNVRGKLQGDLALGEKDCFR